MTLERMMGFEPTATYLASRHSTTELHPHVTSVLTSSLVLRVPGRGFLAFRPVWDHRGTGSDPDAGCEPARWWRRPGFEPGISGYEPDEIPFLHRARNLPAMLFRLRGIARML